MTNIMPLFMKIYFIQKKYTLKYYFNQSIFYIPSLEIKLKKLKQK